MEFGEGMVQLWSLRKRADIVANTAHVCTALAATARGLLGGRMYSPIHSALAGPIGASHGRGDSGRGLR